MDAPDKVLATPAIRSGLPAGSGWLLLVWGLTLASALAVPYSAHWSRQLLNELATEMTQREKAQAEWGRLVLEQSTWTAHSRVESIATRQLGMRVPEAGEVILVQQP
ncbi:cell division protein FtsL [Pseudomonas sp. MYb185]|uniref:cell division protein FtsL n=1 Tax=Pseudomonas sp. MYb185 TaxID=1848729 RepID=UPI000CFD45DE|nr:cell division protein FtsL [Pseudomonas sp. MYb185]PRB84410.1 cell division protein FtsL [Pseudomonas sp. MYb185]